VVVGDLVTISVDSAFVRDMDGVVTAAGDASIQIKLVSGQYAGYSFTVSKNGGHADAPATWRGWTAIRHFFTGDGSR
jgi:hypothetical protein